MMRGTQNKRAEEIDEHDQPTEPIPRFDLPSFTPTIGSCVSSPDQKTIPRPQPYARPFPQQPPQYPVRSGTYPYLPPAPNIQKRGRPAGGVPPTQSVPTCEPARPARVRRRSAIPLLVGLFFVAVQCLLLMRFILKIVNLVISQSWFSIVYALSEVFVLPFRALWQQVPLQIPSSLEIYTLLAILVYGLFSRILVRILKAVFNSR
jgi:hypothetical protein